MNSSTYTGLSEQNSIINTWQYFKKCQENDLKPGIGHMYCVPEHMCIATITNLTGFEKIYLPCTQ